MKFELMKFMLGASIALSLSSCGLVDALLWTAGTVKSPWSKEKEQRWNRLYDDGILLVPSNRGMELYSGAKNANVFYELSNKPATPKILLNILKDASPRGVQLLAYAPLGDDYIRELQKNNCYVFKYEKSDVINHNLEDSEFFTGKYSKSQRYQVYRYESNISKPERKLYEVTLPAWKYDYYFVGKITRNKDLQDIYNQGFKGYISKRYRRSVTIVNGQ